LANTNLKAAQTTATNRGNDKRAAETALKDADATLKAQQDAKTARALLDQRKVDSTKALETAQASLKVVEDAAAALEKEAQPERDKLATELAIVDKAEQAKKTIDDHKTERGRYQAISDEIALRTKDRQSLVDERDQYANSKLVLNYEQLTAEYQALSRRIDAYEFLRARGMVEDAAFEHEQKAAQDRFREAATQAAADAVKVLDAYCPAYGKAAYPNFAELRPAILESLWKLYYDAGIDAAAAENVCYYVIVQSGAGTDALDKLDNRWKAYLTEALGKEGYEKAAEFTAEDLRKKE
jgi:hypothetical protein